VARGGQPAHEVLPAHRDPQGRKDLLGHRDQAGHRGHPDRRDPLALPRRRLSTPW
jgi:hypothetical protein